MQALRPAPAPLLVTPAPLLVTPAPLLVTPAPSSPPHPRKRDPSYPRPAAGISPRTAPKPLHTSPPPTTAQNHPATSTPPPSFLRPLPSFLRRQEPTARRRSIPPPPTPGGTRTGRRLAGARRGAGGRLDSCLRRNDGKEAWRGLGARHSEIPAPLSSPHPRSLLRHTRAPPRVSRRAQHPSPSTPPLHPATSMPPPSFLPPLPSFLRRQEPTARRRSIPPPPTPGGAQTALGQAVGLPGRVAALEVAWIPACAGMTERKRERALVLATAKHPRALLRHTRTPSSVIPALVAGISPSTAPKPLHPTPAQNHSVTSAPPSVIPAPSRHSCAGRNPPRRDAPSHHLRPPAALRRHLDKPSGRRGASRRWRSPRFLPAPNRLAPRG